MGELINTSNRKAISYTALAPTHRYLNGKKVEAGYMP